MGVALIMNKQSVSTLMEGEPINERLIKARLNSKILQTHYHTMLRTY